MFAFKCPSVWSWPGNLYAWLQSTDPVPAAAPNHELLIPDVARVGLSVWKAVPPQVSCQ